MVVLLRRLTNPPVLSALLALLVFAITLGGVFIYDDVAVIEKDPRIADPGRWGEYWTDSYNFGVDNLYRPLVSMTYALQYWLHGPWPMPFHLVNWLLHALASALVAMFAGRLARACAIEEGPSRTIAWVAGLLFAVHPVHVEAVANVVGRAELLCATGVLGALLLFLAPLTPRRVAGVVGCFLLALLSKEQGMLVPLLLGVLWLNLRPASPSQPVAGAAEKVPPGSLLFVSLALLLAGYVVYRESILKFWWDKNFLDPWIQPLAAPGVTPADRLLVGVSIMGRYLQLLVAPIALRIDYGGPIVPGRFDARDPYFYAGLLAIGLWLGLFGLALRQRDRFSLICLLGFAFLYGLVGNLVTLLGVNVAERLMYLPSAFFLLIVARWMARLDWRFAFGLLAAITLLFSARSLTYAARWNDPLGFYLYATRVEPRSVKATQLALLQLLEQDRLDEAEAYARRAILLRPEGDDVQLQLATVLIRKGMWGEAQQAIDTARELNPAGRWGVYQDQLEAAQRGPRRE